MLRPGTNATRSTHTLAAGDGLPPAGGGSNSHSHGMGRLQRWYRLVRKNFTWRRFVIGFGLKLLIFKLIMVFFFPTPTTELMITELEKSELTAFSKSLSLDSTIYSPIESVAFAIPVGGRTERSVGLRRILDTLVGGGAPRENIFVFEDVQSRMNRLPSELVTDTIQKFNAEAQSQLKTAPIGLPIKPIGKVSLIPTQIPRVEYENEHTFGIHLARHYKYMLDYMLVGDTEVQASRAADQLRASQSIGVNPSTTGKSGTPPFEYVVIIEDDLVLAPDLVKYFHSMSRVMRLDPTIYCVAAHQDNAFTATSREEPPTTLKLDPQQFAFRRGNHFMAPGWMTSRRNYVDIVRPKWLDAQGNYAFKTELHLKNGHWDRFFDSLIGTKDCIFPEIPRIIHEGADGFTVSKKGQMELYSNLRLSQLPPSVDYGDLTRMSLNGYRVQISEFIAQGHVLTVLEESTSYRHQRLIYHVQARDDKDYEWNMVLNNYFGLIGVGGYGGYEGYVKVRGIFHGAVFVRWATNLILLVGAYSEFSPLVQARLQIESTTNTAVKKLLTAPLTYEGCYSSLSFSNSITHYTRATISPLRCTLSCAYLGYNYGAIIHGVECRCTQTIDQLKTPLPLYSCSDTCLGAAAHSTIRSVVVMTGSLIRNSQPCGGETSASVYSLGDSLILPPQSQSIDLHYVSGGEDESCTQVCEAKGFTCNEEYFTSIHRSCIELSKLMGCTTCSEEGDIERGFSTPGRVTRLSPVCSLSKGKYISCTAKPPTGFLRACVCVDNQLGLQGNGQLTST